MHIKFHETYGNDLNYGRGFDGFQEALSTIDPDRHEKVSFWKIRGQVWMLVWEGGEWKFTAPEDMEDDT